MPDSLARVIKPLTSLRLTIVCLSLAMVLVFMGTLAQQNLDAFYAQKKYFDTWFVFWTPRGTGLSIPVFPGGFLLGSVFLVNLTAAHLARFKLAWKKAGIILAHTGLILLLLGGLFTALWSRESQMIIPQGGTKNYTESFKEFELAIVDTSAADHDHVVAIPASMLAKGGTIQVSGLPFAVKPIRFYQNARLNMRQPGSMAPQIADKGMGVRMDAVPLPPTTRPDEENFPAAFVTLQPAAGAALGTWLLWASPFGESIPSQTVTVDGKKFELTLRLKRFYKPYQIHLNHLTHEEYAGTDIPRNFASNIHLTDPSRHEDREILIYMNHPLRYSGETFYQYQTLANDKFTVLEVVRNPSWLLPYISCSLVALGLVVQFGMHLVNFSKKRFG